jgi:RND family efflux transporter MFP subunit
VAAGQLVARLDDAESRQQVAIAEATLSAAKQTAERVHADLARSEAVLAQARLASTRQTKLVAGRATSQSDVDKSDEALRVAEADLKRAHASIAEAAGQVMVAAKNLLFRKEQLAFTEIHSPYDGLIIRRDRDPGDIVVPGASLLEIISLKELWVSAWVDETGMPALSAGQPARVIFRAEPGRSYSGTVSRLGREMDRETREFLVDVRVTELPINWSVGQRAEVYIQTGRQAAAVLLPSAFLTYKGSQAGVFVDIQGRAQWRDVTLGMRGPSLVAVTDGLTVGDQVLRVREGQNLGLAAGDRIAAP